MVRKVAVDGSELLADIGERLNKEMRAVKNWRNLAYRLEIPHEEYDAFDTSKVSAKSPTKMLFEWLQRWKPNLTVKDLLTGLKQIDRYDVVDLVRLEVATGKSHHFSFGLADSILGLQREKIICSPANRFFFQGMFSFEGLHVHVYILVNKKKFTCNVEGKSWKGRFNQTGKNVLDKVEQNMVICQWQADQLSAESEGRGK